jgi:hypothetical protein
LSKIQEKQGIRSIGIISMFLLLAVSLGATAPVWNGASSEARQKTMRRAEGLAYQLLDGQRSSERGIASAGNDVEMNQLVSDEGEIGLDIWGHPFHFKMLKNQEGEKLKIIVWSRGPNGLFETQDPTQFLGDDLGTHVSLK